MMLLKVEREGRHAYYPYDQLPELAVYRGHMADQLTGTSNIRCSIINRCPCLMDKPNIV